MAYTSIAELPSQVRNSLSEDDQEQWMKSYNECDPKNESDIKEARKKAWMECKDKPSSFSFHAVASVEDWDKDTEKIDVDTLMKSMDRYIDSGGPLSLDHRNYTIGCIWSYEPFEKNGMKGMAIWGNLFGGDDGVYDKVRGMFVKGMNSFSVAGESADKKYECDGHACGFKRSVSELLEIALCRTPANKHAVMLSYNDKVATPFSKSAGDVVIRFDQVEVHRDESSCPILKLRKSLRNAGIDAHAREDGVFIPMDSATFAKTVGTMRNAGLCVQWADGGALVRDQDAVLEGLFKEGFTKGIVDENGVLDTSDHMFFAKACDMGLVARKDGQYRLINPTEDFMKYARWKDFGEAGRQARDASAPPRRYLRLFTGILDPDAPAQHIDPSRVGKDKYGVDSLFNFDYARGGAQVHRGQPPNALYAGPFREDQKKPSDFIRAYSNIPKYSDKDWKSLKGETFTLHPKARRLYINDFNQLKDLFEKYKGVGLRDDDPHRQADMEDFGYKPSLDYDRMKQDYDVLEWGPKMKHLAFMNKVAWENKDYKDYQLPEGYKVPLTDEEISIGRDLSRKYNLPNENIDEIMVLNGYVDPDKKESIFQDIQPFDMSTRRVKTTPEQTSNEKEGQQAP